MAFSENFDMRPVRFGDLDAIVDEKGTQFIALRKVQWVKNGEEPDESKAKFEIRKYLVDKDGTEKPQKGVSFLTPEGPGELARVLVHEGFGDTKDILKELKGRNDFRDAVETLNQDEDDTTGEYFDMRTLLEDDEEDEEDNLEEAS